MRCPGCKSEDIKYLNPYEWVQFGVPNKQGGYHCKQCGKYFSFQEGTSQ